MASIKGPDFSRHPMDTRHGFNSRYARYEVEELVRHTSLYMRNMNHEWFKEIDKTHFADDELKYSDNDAQLEEHLVKNRRQMNILRMFANLKNTAHKEWNMFLHEMRLAEMYSAVLCIENSRDLQYEAKEAVHRLGFIASYVLKALINCGMIVVKDCPPTGDLDCEYWPRSQMLRVEYPEPPKRHKDGSGYNSEGYKDSKLIDPDGLLQRELYRCIESVSKLTVLLPNLIDLRMNNRSKHELHQVIHEWNQSQDPWEFVGFFDDEDEYDERVHGKVFEAVLELATVYRLEHMSARYLASLAQISDDLPSMKPGAEDPDDKLPYIWDSMNEKDCEPKYILNNVPIKNHIVDERIVARDILRNHSK